MRAAEFTADGGCVALVEEDGRTTLRRWGAPAWTTPVDVGPGPVLRCSPDGRWIALADHIGNDDDDEVEDGVLTGNTRVSMFSAHDGVPMWTTTEPPGNDPATLTVDPRGRPVTGGGRVVVRDLYTGEPVDLPVATQAAVARRRTPATPR